MTYTPNLAIFMYMYMYRHASESIYMYSQWGNPKHDIVAWVHG